VALSDQAACCPHAVAQGRSASDGDLAGADLAEQICHVYLCRGLSTYRIAAIVGISRRRVGRMLRQTGVPVKPRGAGRRRATADPAAVAALKDLYLRFRLTSGQIASLAGVPERTVRDRLRAAHDLGLPVRIGGPAPRGGPAGIELPDALYADPMVRRVMARHGLPRVPAGGPISLRFPVPLSLNPELAAELHDECGLGLRHIELLTGQPGDTVRAMPHRYGVRLRGPGGRSPFLPRWWSHIARPRTGRGVTYGP
jgi:hypothetical protein